MFGTFTSPNKIYREQKEKMKRLRCRENKLRAKWVYTQTQSSREGEDKILSQNCVRRIALGRRNREGGKYFQVTSPTFFISYISSQ